MNITVDRTTNPRGDLIFTVTVSQPHHACFGENEKKIMGILESCKEEMHHVTSKDNGTKEDAISLIHDAKEKTFIRVLNNLKFAIENQFRPKFRPICQEIYNWIYDNQIGDLKAWMEEFDPQRTKYYFDNDLVAANTPSDQESEHENEDEDEDEQW